MSASLSVKSHPTARLFKKNKRCPVSTSPRLSEWKKTIVSPSYTSSYHHQTMSSFMGMQFNWLEFTIKIVFLEQALRVSRNEFPEKKNSILFVHFSCCLFVLCCFVMPCIMDRTAKWCQRHLASNPIQRQGYSKNKRCLVSTSPRFTHHHIIIKQCLHLWECNSIDLNLRSKLFFSNKF